jgi:CRP-like cAMP-binding protein
VRVPDRVFDEVFVRDPALALKTCRLCSERLSGLQKLLCLDQETADFRVAEVLRQDFIKHGARLALTRQTLSVRVGATIETVFRALAAFRRRGWIETRRGCVVIKEPAALAAYVRRRRWK